MIIRNNVSFIKFGLVAGFGCVFAVACTKKPVREDFAYTIMDASLSSRPSWVENEDAWDKGDYRYFVGTSENVNKTLCQKGARSNASEKVSEEIVRNVVDDYTRNISNTDSLGDGGKVNSVLSSSEIQKIKHYTETRLGGIGNEKSYWEQRRYKTEMGATQDKQQFNCWAIVKVRKDVLGNFINNVNKDFKLGDKKGENDAN